MRPALEQRSLAAVRTALGEAATKRRQDEVAASHRLLHAVSEISKTSVALAGIDAVRRAAAVGEIRRDDHAALPADLHAEHALARIP